MILYTLYDRSFAMLLSTHFQLFFGFTKKSFLKPLLYPKEAVMFFYKISDLYPTF